MKEIKIIFDSEDINVQAEGMSGHVLLTALGTAFIAECEEFNVEPLRAIEILMDAEDVTEDGKDEDDESFWYDGIECCDVCEMPYGWCECDEGVFWVENDEEEEE
mgnify:CR=1 FL=1